MAQEERDHIRKRQREGIDAAKKQGKTFGRPKAQATNEFMEAYNEWKKGNITATRAMQQANVKKTTFYKLVKQVERDDRSEEHTSELQSRGQLVCRLLLEKKKQIHE